MTGQLTGTLNETAFLCQWHFLMERKECINSARSSTAPGPDAQKVGTLTHSDANLLEKLQKKRRSTRPSSCSPKYRWKFTDGPCCERKECRMKKTLFLLLLLLLGSTPVFAQMQEPGGTPQTPDSDQFGTPPPTTPDLGDRGGVDPCPPRSTTPDLNQGDRGGLGDSELDQRALPPPGSVPPNPPGSIPPNPPGSIPPNPPGSIPQNPQGSVPGDQGGSFGRPDTGNRDQLGTTDCPPSGTDRGGLNQGGGSDNPSGQEVPESEQQTPPPLLPPSGGVQ